MKPPRQDAIGNRDVRDSGYGFQWAGDPRQVKIVQVPGSRLPYQSAKQQLIDNFRTRIKILQEAIDALEREAG